MTARSCALLLILGMVLFIGTGVPMAQAAEINTSALSQNGWFSDDTRADGTGTQSAGTNLISPTLTDDPEATASGNAAHDADILSMIMFGGAPGTVPFGTHPGAVHLQIGASGSGKSQISHRDTGAGGHGPGSAFGPGFTMDYSWMGDGTVSVTASIKFGIRTSDFGSTGVSGRTGENAWDKVLIYEPGNLNGGTSDGLWHTENVTHTSGKWWFFDRTVGASTIGVPMTLADMAGALGASTVFSGAKTAQDVYNLIVAGEITSVQTGIGSGNAGGSVYVNELSTSAYRSSDVTTFGSFPVHNITQATDHNTIQEAINAATAGDLIQVDAGNFPELVVVNKDLTIQGAGEGVTVIDGSSFTAASNVVSISGTNVTLSGLTVDGGLPHYTAWPPPKPWYGIGISGPSAVNITNVTVMRMGKTGFNMNGANPVNLSDVTAMDNGGAGFFCTDAHNVTFNNVTTLNNQWAGVAIATQGGTYPPAATSGMVFTGTNSFGEAVSGPGGYQGGLFLEDNTGGAAPISWSTTGGTDVTILAADFTHTLNGDQDDALPRTRFYASQNDAVLAALQADDALHVIGPGHYLLTGRYIRSIATGSFYVADGMEIQPAINAATNGDLIEVAAGTFSENLNLGKSLTLEGAQVGVAGCGRVTGSPNPAVESVLTAASGRIITLLNGCAGAVIDGFALDGAGNASRGIESTGGPLDNLVIQNNHISGTTGSGIFLNNSGIDVTVHQNETDGTVAAGVSGGGYVHLDTDSFPGFYFTSNCALNQTAGYGLFVDGNRNVNPSVSRAPLFDDNVFDNNSAGMSFGKRAFLNTTFSNNTFSNNLYDGGQGGPKDCVFTGNTFSNNARYGLRLTSFGDTDPAKGAQGCTITGNTFSGNVVAGLQLDTGQAVGTISTNVANNNDFVGNVVGARYTGTESIDASCNWWNDIFGPDTPSNPNPAGDDLSGTSLVYWPWLDGSITGSPNCDQYGNDNVFADTAALTCITAATPCVTVPVEFVRSDATPARGVTVTFQLSSGLSLCGAGIVQGSWLSGYGFGSSFQVVDNGGGSYTVDQAILGVPCGPTVGGTLFTVDVTGTVDGTESITVTSVDARDCGNPFAIIPGIPGAPGYLTIDYTAPGAIADLAAAQQLSGNGVDGTTDINLSWTVVPEPDAATVEIYRKGFGFYPEYDDLGGAAPSAPATPAAAITAGWALAASVSATLNSYADEPANRDYWYYVAYVVDDCGNVGAVSNRTDGDLNYHLGDFSPLGTPGDNDVGTLDVSALGAAYGTNDGDTFYANYVDIGPTATNGTLSLPQTDDQIQFEDLIIFAINYGVVSKPAGPAADRNEMLAAIGDAGGSDLEVKLTLASTGNVQAVSVPFSWNPEAVEPIGFTNGDFLDRSHGVAFQPAVGTIDIAALGGAFRGEGDVVTLRFRVIGSGDPEIGFGEVDARDTENRPVTLPVTLASDRPGISVVTRLMPSAPNPFRAGTTVAYSLAEPGQVKVQVYSLDGRLVRTLLDELRPAGDGQIVWDGADGRGRSVASGTYLIRMESVFGSDTQRVVRLK